jgi:hypothetical protein
MGRRALLGLILWGAGSAASAAASLGDAFAFERHEDAPYEETVATRLTFQEGPSAFPVRVEGGYNI